MANLEMPLWPEEWRQTSISEGPSQTNSDSMSGGILSGLPTFGYGRLLPDSSPAGKAAFQRQLNGMTIDQKQALADQYFSDDIRQAQANVFNRLGSEGVSRLSQPQYDALVADSFNAGRAPALGQSMTKDIRNGDLAAAGQEFNAYWAKNKETGQWEVPEGLVKRSLQDSRLFNEGDYTYDPLQDRSRAAIKAIIANPGCGRLRFSGRGHSRTSQFRG